MTGYSEELKSLLELFTNYINVGKDVSAVIYYRKKYIKINIIYKSQQNSGMFPQLQTELKI